MAGKTYVAYTTRDQLETIATRQHQEGSLGNTYNCVIRSHRPETHDTFMTQLSDQDKPVRVLIKVVEDSPLEVAWDSLSRDEAMALIHFGGSADAASLTRCAQRMRAMADSIERASLKLEAK